MSHDNDNKSMPGWDTPKHASQGAQYTLHVPAMNAGQVEYGIC